MSRTLRILLLLVLCAPLAPLHAAEALIALTPAQRAALRVSVAPLTASARAASVELPARVVLPPSQARLVAAPIAGIVSEVRAAQGDVVKAGQILALMRGEGLIGAQREIAQAAVQLRQAEETLLRDEALYKEGIIPESRLQGARAGRAQAAALLNERRAWLRLMGLGQDAIRAAEAGERLSDSLALVSPISGVVLEQTAVVGARVEGAAQLFKLARLDPLWLEIQVPAEMAARVKPGQQVRVGAGPRLEMSEPPPGGAKPLMGRPGARLERDVAATGTVISVERRVSDAQTVAVRARVAGAGDRLRLNQSVSARLEGASGARQWQVPLNALARQAGQSWVFVERPGGFLPQPVTVLSQAGQSASIDGPFKGTEKLAVDGVAALKAAWQGMGGE